tara:strand:+ start:51 stop:710 length:660 start_codon:yes stop_codon:yes gene_type:complete
MRIDNYKKYKFKDYPVLGILTQLDFTDTSNIKIIPHEEIENQIEGNDLNLVNSFEPLLFCTDFPDLNFTDNQGIDIDYLTLLDGHHRYDFIKRNNINTLLEAVIVSKEDVKVSSHLSKLKVSEEEFYNFLNDNNFKINNDSKLYLNLDDIKYSSDDVTDIYKLYDFKRKCFENGLITSFPNDINNNEKSLVTFSPINLDEFYEDGYLFPPKSTWITPRL